MEATSTEQRSAPIQLSEETQPTPWPRADQPDTGIELVGCHGGAGTSTLASLFPAARDLGTFDQRTFDALQVEGPLLLVARDTVPASMRITETVNVLGLLGQPIAGLVLMAEAPGRVPPHAQSRIRLLEGSVPAVLRIPYIPQFRFLDQVSAAQVKLPRKARSAMRKISELWGPSQHLPHTTDPLNAES